MTSGASRPPRGASIAALREHLEQAPSDDEARLALADLLVAEGQRPAARAVLHTPPETPVSLRRAFVTRLATWDEEDGNGAAAVAEWESLLADDIDDGEAWKHLERLRELGVTQGAAARSPATLASAEGVNTSRYEILEEIGRGGAATVYLVRERLIGLRLALKVLHPHLAAPGRAAARARFFAEARMAAALRHPNVVALYDIDEETRTLAMEHLAGGTLRDRLRHLGSAGLPLDEVSSFARSLLSGLAYVHERGIVHGDITPRNLLLRAPGVAVLADFGNARLQEDDPGAAGDDAPAGTPLYLAPEQLRGAGAAAAADLFSCGAVLWEALAGRPMRVHTDLAADRFAAPPLPPGVGGGRLAAVVTALTATAASDRPATAREALAALGP